jgi:hypothetical protein
MDSPNTNDTIHIATNARNLWKTPTSSEALKNNWGKIESQWTLGPKVGKGEVLHSERLAGFHFTFDVTCSGERNRLSYFSYKQARRQARRSDPLQFGRMGQLPEHGPLVLLGDVIEIPPCREFQSSPIRERRISKWAFFSGMRFVCFPA